MRLLRLTVLKRLVIYIAMARPANPEIRSRLIARGQQLVHRQGFNATGVQDITAAASVPKGSFYNYFKTKEEFGVEILGSFWSAIEDAHIASLSDPTHPPLARISRFFHDLSDSHETWGFELGCMIGNLALEVAGQSETTRWKVSQLLRRWETPIVACLREAQQSGDLAEERDPQAIAAVLVEAYEGAVMRAKIERSRAPYTRFEEFLLPRMLI